MVSISPLRLEQILDGILASDASDHDTPVQVTGVEALGPDIFLGCSDGSLRHYAQSHVATSNGAYGAYELVSNRTVPGGNGVSQISIAPSVSKALVRSEHTLFFYSLPTLELDKACKPIKNVNAFAIDEEHKRMPPSYLNDIPIFAVPPAEFCVSKMNGDLHLYSLRETPEFTTGIQFESRVKLAVRCGRKLCIADETEYNIVDVVDGTLTSLMPISSAPPDSEVPPHLTPIISGVSENHFLVWSWTGSNVFGVVATGQGDPIRFIDRPTFPKAVCTDGDNAVILFPDNTLQLYDSAQDKNLLEIHAPVGTRLLSSSFSGYVVPSSLDSSKLHLVSMPVLRNSERGHDESHQVELEEKKHEVDHPSTSKRQASRRSTVLLASSSRLHALTEPTTLSEFEDLMHAGRAEEATVLASELMKRLSENIVADEAKMTDIRYMYQRLGFHCLFNTVFEEAGAHLYTGEADLRLLLRHFPHLYGTMLTPTERIPVFRGVESIVVAAEPIEEIVILNLVRNYSPHIKPSTRSATPTTELRKVLVQAAHDMLERFLQRWRNTRREDNGQDAQHLNEVVDTILVKLWAMSEKTDNIYRLLRGNHDVIVYEANDALIQHGQYKALATLYEQVGDEERLLEVWSKIVDGSWSEPDIPDALFRMVARLDRTRKRELRQRWSLWLIQRDSAQALRLLSHPSSKHSSSAEDVSTFIQIKEANVHSAMTFAQQLILQRRGKVHASLHEELAQYMTDQLVDSLQNSDLKISMERINIGYHDITDKNDPFLSHWATSVPFSDFRRLRLKTVLLLQLSTSYNAQSLLDKLGEHKDLLPLEIVILYGKVGDHASALDLLVSTLRDFPSAEVYCTLGGDVLSTHSLHLITELEPDIKPWVELLLELRTSKDGVAALEEARQAMLGKLLRAYMRGGKETMDHACQLLSAQSIHFPVSDVVETLPADWPVAAVSVFLSRSFRRIMHARRDGQILKNISAGQNLDIADSTYGILREQGAIVEEVLEDDGDASDAAEKVEVLQEKMPSDAQIITNGMTTDHEKRSADAYNMDGVDEIDVR